MVKVVLECGDHRAEFEGSVDEAIKFTLKFFFEVCEKCRLASELLATKDLSFLLDLKGLVRVSKDEGVVFLGDAEKLLPLKEAILLVIGLNMLNYRLNYSKSPGVKLSEISEKLTSPQKSISARLTELHRAGLVKKAKRGVYELTTKGVFYLESKVVPKLKKARK